jgi:hypothetical protein
MRLPKWIREGTFTEPWEEAPDRGDMVTLRVDFVKDLSTGDGEEWSCATLAGRTHNVFENAVTAMVSPTSKLCPPELAGHWDVELQRDDEDQPWKLVSMVRRK